MTFLGSLAVVLLLGAGFASAFEVWSMAAAWGFAAAAMVVGRTL